MLINKKKFGYLKEHNNKKRENSNTNSIILLELN